MMAASTVAVQCRTCPPGRVDPYSMAEVAIPVDGGGTSDDAESTAAAAPSAREARKLEAIAQRERELAAKNLTHGLRQALKVASPERTAEQNLLIECHPDEAARVREAMEKAAARKQQAEANATEVEEDADILRSKAVELAKLLREARHAVIYTGAGVSTAASIPDYRGPNGLWTLAQKGAAHNAPCAARASMGQSFAEATPTSGHLAIAALVKKGLVKQVVSQNVDGLHMRSGVPASKLCELHGNVFFERCPSCDAEILRGFDVTGRSAYHRHGTGRTCERPGCDGAELRDTIVYFGERIHDKRLEVAREQSEACDLAIFIGSSLKVLAHYGFIWAQPPKPQPRKRFVIINLQPTPKDKLAHLRIHGRCDAVLELLLGALRLKPLRYVKEKDEVRRLSAAHAAAQYDTAAKEEEEEAVEAEDNEEDDAADGDGSDGTGAAEGGAAEGGAPARKRRKRGVSWKRRAMPRAFPAEPPPPPRGGATKPPDEADEGRQEVKTESVPPPPSTDAADPPEEPAAAIAPKKCAAKCGFYASAGTDYCSKCYAKQEAEWADWHGVLSKKR